MRHGMMALLLAACSVGSAAVTLPPVFASGMVLQRGKAIPVYGMASPGEPVTVAFAGQRVTGTADASGRWSVTLRPLELSAKPRDLKVSGRDSEVSLHNVLVGDVWFASGQSNMEMRLREVFNAEQEVADARHELIRFYTVRRELSSVPQSEPQGVWETCTPKTAGRFSAAAYFFAREITRRVGVPIGIINSSVGSSGAECWVPGEALRRTPGMPQPPSNMSPEEYVDWATYDAVRRRQRELDSYPDAGISKEAESWSRPEFDDSSWGLVPIPADVKGYGLGKVDGAFWFRCEVDIPEDMVGRTAQLDLSFIYHRSVAFVNGRRLGHIECDGREWFGHRYTIPKNVLKAGRNSVAVRIVVEMGPGGFYPPYPHRRNISVPGKSVPLPERWRFRAEATRPAQKPGRDLPNGYRLASVLYNGMTHAYTRTPIRGFIWYQGETNAGRAAEHRTLFPLLIQSWRQAWGDDTLPFYFVQLPDYQQRSDNPNDGGGWAEFRFAQQDTLERVPHTGMGVTLGIGEPNNVHPRNKQECGRRLALWALRDVYGVRDLPVCGPLFASARREGAAIRLEFSHVYGGLRASDGQALRGFAIAGADRRFVWAQATVTPDGRAVTISAPSVPEPRHVRYAWATNPDANLANSAGLPAGSFHADVD